MNHSSRWLGEGRRLETLLPFEQFVELVNEDSGLQVVEDVVSPFIKEASYLYELLKRWVFVHLNDSVINEIQESVLEEVNTELILLGLVKLAKDLFEILAF